MKTFKSISLVLLLAATVLLPACRTTSAPPAQCALATPSELTELPYLYEIVRYLYRWQLDESEIQKILGEKQFVFWVRPVAAKLDAGDRSQFAEILLPQLNVSVKVKKADYTIEETGTVVQSRNFRITHVIRGPVPACPVAAVTVVLVDMQAMRDYLFRTRNQHDYPDAALVEHLRQAVREQAAKEGMLPTNAPADLIVHFAPLSPVANEEWVFWEAGRKLIYIASDIDLANPAVWQQQTLSARIYDLDQQVVVSHEEAPGSNRFLTRYQVSRALFNCILFGQRVAVPPYTPPGPK